MDNRGKGLREVPFPYRVYILYGFIFKNKERLLHVKAQQVFKYKPLIIKKNSKRPFRKLSADQLQTFYTV